MANVDKVVFQNSYRSDYAGVVLQVLSLSIHSFLNRIKTNKKH